MSLSADGRTALVGTIRFHESGTGYVGTARVFAKATDGRWSQQAKLISNNGTAADQFGSSVVLSIDGRTAMIGASDDDDRGAYSGAVYVFAKGEDGGWSQQFKLTAEDGAAGDRFGYSLALSADGRTAMIGASGAAYVFAKGEDGRWSQQLKLTAEDGAAGDWFGDSVALSADGRTAMIGAGGDDDRGENSGSVYIFNIPPANASAPVAMMRLRR